MGANNAAYCPADNSIALDADYFEQLRQVGGDFVPISVLAHEWGHLNQTGLGRITPANQMDFTTRTRAERQADCQAGIFAAYAELRGWITMTDARAAFLNFCNLGGMNGWFAPNIYGDCSLRSGYFATGYNAMKARPDSLCALDRTRRVFSMETMCPW